MNEIKEYTNKIFEDIKNIDEESNEYWLARELGKILEYGEYRKFLPAIKKAMISGNIYDLLGDAVAVSDEIKQRGSFIIPKLLLHNVRVVGN